MSVKTIKVNLLPVPKRQEELHLLEEVMKEITPIREILNDWGKKYDHEIPWQETFFENPKFYLYRVTIGAVGRINTCEYAARLGLIDKIPATTHHFTSLGLYLVYRIARQARRRYNYLKRLNKYMQGFINGKKDSYESLRFLVYSNMDN